MKKTTLFRKYIEESEILILPGAHDALTAYIIAQTGFKAFTMGGYSASASLLGKPDMSLLTLTEMVDCVSRMVETADLPLLADGDTGHGGILNVIRTVKEMEKAGAAGLFIEDQVFPKRCGHMEGKQVLPPEDMLAKIKAAADARVDPDLVIMARTDALATHGLQEAIERGNLYREAGADLIFVEAPRTVEEMRRINSEIKAPTLANNLEGGKSPLLPAKELEEIGYNVVVFPVSATYAVTKTISELMLEIKKRGTTASFLERMTTFTEFNSLIGLDSIRALEHGYEEQGLNTMRSGE